MSMPRPEYGVVTPGHLAHGAHVGIGLVELAQGNVRALLPEADRGLERTLQGDPGPSDRVHRLLGHARGDPLLEDLRAGLGPFPVDRGAGGLDDRSGSGDHLGADAVAGDQGDGDAGGYVGVAHEASSRIDAGSSRSHVIVAVVRVGDGGGVASRTMARRMRPRRALAAAALLTLAGLVAMACTSDAAPTPPAPSGARSEPPEPSATVAAAASDSNWIEPTDVLGAPNLVSEPDPALAPKGVDTRPLRSPPELQTGGRPLASVRSCGRHHEPRPPGLHRAGEPFVRSLLRHVPRRRRHPDGRERPAEGLPARPRAGRVPPSRTTTRTSSIKAAPTARSAARSRSTAGRWTASSRPGA